MISLIISNKSITCIEWEKEAGGVHIAHIVDNPYYKQLLLSGNPAEIISEALNNISSEIGMLGQEIEVLLDDHLVQIGGLTIDKELDEDGVRTYIEWWVNQSWPEAFDHYEINHFYPETDSSFIWISGIDRTILDAIRQTLRQSGGRLMRCSPVSSAFISLDYPKNSIWTFIESRSYQLSGSVGSLPFRASIRFYSGEIQASSIVGDTKLVESLLRGPSFRTPFRFIEELSEGRSHIWKDMPVQNYELDPELKAFGETHGWKRDLRRNLGVLSVIIASETTNRILNFFDDTGHSEPQPKPDLEEDRRLKRLERLERAREAEAEASLSSRIEKSEKTPKKSHPVRWILVLILLIGGIYYSGLVDPYLGKWIPSVSAPGSPVHSQKPPSSGKGNMIAELRKNSFSMLHYTSAWLKNLTASGFAIIDGKVVIYTGQGENVFSLTPEEAPITGVRIQGAAAADSIRRWEIGPVKTFQTAKYRRGKYLPVIIKLNKSEFAEDIGNRLLQLGDNVVLRKVLVKKIGDQAAVFFYIAIFS